MEGGAEEFPLTPCVPSRGGSPNFSSNVKMTSPRGWRAGAGQEGAGGRVREARGERGAARESLGGGCAAARGQAGGRERRARGPAGFVCSAEAGGAEAEAEARSSRAARRGRPGGGQGGGGRPRAREGRLGGCGGCGGCGPGVGARAGRPPRAPPAPPPPRPERGGRRRERRRRRRRRRQHCARTSSPAREEQDAPGPPPPARTHEPAGRRGGSAGTTGGRGHAPRWGPRGAGARGAAPLHCKICKMQSAWAHLRAFLWAQTGGSGSGEPPRAPRGARRVGVTGASFRAPTRRPLQPRARTGAQKTKRRENRAAISVWTIHILQKYNPFQLSPLPPKFAISP